MSNFSHYFFCSQIIGFKFWWILYIICCIIMTSITSVLGGLVCFFCEELVLCRIITQNFHSSWIFFYLGFISKTLAIHGTAEEGRVPYQFLYTISTHSQTFKHLFTVLHLRWLPYIFNCVGYRFSIDNTFPYINL